MQYFESIAILITNSQSIAKFQKYCNTLQYYWNHPCHSYNDQISPDKGFNRIIVFDKYKKVFAEMKRMDSKVKMVTKSETVYEHPNELPSGAKYIKHFPTQNCTTNFEKYTFSAVLNLPSR